VIVGMLAAAGWKKDALVSPEWRESILTITDPLDCFFDVVVDLEFQGKFVLGRSTPYYQRELKKLPRVFVGNTQELGVKVGTMTSEGEQSFELLSLAFPPWRTLPALLSVYRSCFGQDHHHLAHLVSITNQALAVVRSKGGLEEVGSTALSKWRNDGISNEVLKEAWRLRGALAKFHPSLWRHEYRQQECLRCVIQHHQQQNEVEEFSFEKVTYAIVVAESNLSTLLKKSLEDGS
jgi:hypothetical protein